MLSFFKYLFSIGICYVACTLSGCMKFEPIQMPFDRFDTMYFDQIDEGVRLVYVSNDSFDTIYDHELYVREATSGNDYDIVLLGRCMSEREKKKEKVETSVLPDGMPFYFIPLPGYNKNTDSIFYFDVNKNQRYLLEKRETNTSP